MMGETSVTRLPRPGAAADWHAQLPRPESGEHLRRIAREALGRDTDWVTVAFYPAMEDGAGPADVTVSAYAVEGTTFYRIASVKAGIDLTTGTGLHDLTHDIAEAISAGMLGVSEDDEGVTA